MTKRLLTVVTNRRYYNDDVSFEVKDVFRRLKSTSIAAMSLLLIATLLPALATPMVSAAPADLTTAGSLLLTPAVENIGVVSYFTGDTNGNNYAILEYRQSGASQWQPGVPMSVDRRSTLEAEENGSNTLNPFQNTWRASIFWLETDTQYEVRVTYTDPDGVNGSSTVSGTITTRNDNPPSSGNTYYVGTGGNDDNGDGSVGSPWRTIQHAVDSVSAGDTIMVGPGTYSEEVQVDASGTANNYITIRSQSLTNRAVIDGGESLADNFYITGDYIRIKGLVLTGVDDAAIILDEADYAIVEDCTINEFGWGYWDAGVLVSNSAGALIQRNEFSRSTGIDYSESCAIFLYQTLGEHVIRDNQVLGPERAFKDGVGGDMNGMIGGGPQNTTYIYDNYMEGTWDDGIEIEGGDINIGVWGNVLDVAGGNMGIGIAPILIGPVYIFRNVFLNFREAAFKMGGESFGALYAYHNSCYTLANGAGPADFGHTPNSGNSVFRNNIYAVHRFVIGDPAIGGNTYDYDNGVIVPGYTYNSWWVDTRYYSLGDFQTASGQEAHGIAENPLFLDPDNGVLTLQSESPCIDAGTMLPGFNNANSPWPYSGAAPDIGAYEYGSGGPTNYPPTLYPIGDKSVDVEELLQFTVSATDPNYDPLDFSADNLPPGATFNSTTRIFSWTPTSSQAGTYPNIYFEVSDGELTDSEEITITVLSGDENQPPVLHYIGDKDIDMEEPLEFIISATDLDDDPLDFSADSLPPGATFNSTSRIFSWTPTSSQAGTYPNIYFEVSDGELTDSEEITITVSALPVPTSLPLRVNAAGNEYIDSQSNTWIADQAYNSGSWGFYGPDHATDRGTGHAIIGTVDDRIYQTERWGLDGYRFDLANGSYTVILHFAETYSGITGPGQRVFNVSIEGQLVLDNLDIYSEAGYSTALEKVFNDIAVQDGQLNIVFTSSIEEPEINGIEILSAGGNEPPVLDEIGNKSVEEGELLEFTVSASDPDEDSLIYSASNLPAGATFDPDTRTFSWKPGSSQVGTHPNVRFTVSDGSLTDFEIITITVVQFYEDWDVNGDGSTNILDAILIGQHWGETGLAGWIRADVNKDGIINVLDMIIIGQNWTG